MSRNSDANDALRLLRDEVRRLMDYRAFFLRHLNGEVRASGGRVQAMCPIPSHGHTGKGSPSFSADVRRGLFHCFSRDEGGDVFTFYGLMHGATFPQAVRALARELGIDTDNPRQPSLALDAAPDADAPGLEHLEPLDADRMSALCEAFLATCRDEDQLEGLNYLTRRGIDARTARRAGITYFPRRAYRRVMRRMGEAFPAEELRRGGLFNARGRLTFYRHRLLFPFYVEGRARYIQARTTAAGVEPRWHNLRGGVPALYNADALAKLPSGTVVYLVEGFTDTLTLVGRGFAAVGLVGAGGMREEWLGPLGRFRTVAALDPDVAGRRAAARYEEMFRARGLALAVIDLPSDVNDFFRQHANAADELRRMTVNALRVAEESMPSVRV